MTFTGLAICFVSCRALWCGYKGWRDDVKTGHSTDAYEKTGEIISFQGGFVEGLLYTTVKALGLIMIPGLFWIITGLQVLVMYVFNSLLLS
jgi:hypothetical protein